MTEKKCEQNCGKPAEVYAGGQYANDWAGYYCQECADGIKDFVVFDKLAKETA